MTSSAAQVAAWRASKRGTPPPYHGTKHVYDAYGCRCAECRADVARIARRTYARRRT